MKKSKYVDVSAIVQVIGCIFNDPSLLEIKDKYIITENDFVEEFHKIVFGSIYNIAKTGSLVTIETIEDYLAARPKYNAVFIQNKGEEYLSSIASIAKKETFNYYYTRLKKMSLLRAYEEIGLDLTDLYDPDEVLDSAKKQKQEDWLDLSSLEKIAATIDLKIDKIKSEYVDEAKGAGWQAGEGIDVLIEELEKNPEVGIPLYGRLINTVTRGARLKKFYLRSGATGTGKAIPNYTIIPTPIGNRKVSDIKVGDYLFGQDGKPTKVLKVFPQEELKEIWKVTFSDGRVAECCKDHLWEYRFESHGGGKYRVESLEEIYNRTLKLKNGLKNSDGKGFRFRIKLNEPIEYSKKEYSVDPYVMGALLGDGSFRYDKTNKALSFSSIDDEIPNKIASLLNGNCIISKNSKYNYSYTFKPVEDIKHNLWVEEILRDYPELWNCKSEDKFIPKDYLQGSIEQRYSLLQGLLDTDGSIDAKGRVNFTTVSPKLKDDMINLCRSLGFIPTLGIDNREGKYTTGECYNIHIQCKKGIKPKLFTLKRKVDIAEKYASSNKREEYKDHLAIVNIEKTSQKTAMTCFTVDNNNSLFLMNDYIVTHNTRALVADACYFACKEIYDENFGWIPLKKVSNPTLFIATEQDLSEVQTLMLAFVSNVNEEHILNGTYEEGERERVFRAGKVLKEANLWVECIPDFSIQDIENLIKKHIRDHDVSYVCYDYLHTSMKILEEVTRRSGGVKLREDNVLFMLATRLKDMCNQYGIFIITSTQLSGDYKTSDSPDQTLLRGAKSLADRADVGAILLSVTDEDLVKLDPILQSGRFETPTLKLSIYKNRRARYKGVYLWCQADLGTCRINPMFCTTFNHQMVSIEDIKIKVEEEGAF